jgi:hypothetical protein
MEWSNSLSAVANRARAAGLSLVAIGNEAARTAGAAAGLSLLPAAAQSKIPWKSADAVVVATGCVWPGITVEARGQESGPTANPWIDSNSWFLRLARVRAPGKVVWMEFEPPPPPRVVLLDAYLRAVADTGAWGGRWVVSLDEDLRRALARGDSKAVASWKTIANAVTFFEQRRAWASLQPQGVVGVISDFEGPNETQGCEMLNLLGRRSLAYRIVPKSNAESTSLASFRALIHIDEDAPSPELRRKLLAWAQQGGLLFAGPGWGPPGGTPLGLDHPRVDVRSVGKGRLAIAKSESPDPFMVARDVHMLLGRAHDVARFFNLAAFRFAGRISGSAADRQLRHSFRWRSGDRVGAR